MGRNVYYTWGRYDETLSIYKSVLEYCNDAEKSSNQYFYLNYYMLLWDAPTKQKGRREDCHQICQ